MLGFTEFCRDERSSLSRIAYATRGELAVDDLVSEAWLMAVEIEGKTHRTLDLTTSSAREVLLSWLYARFVRYANKSMRFAVKLDAAGGDDDAESLGERISRLLRAPDDSDPLRAFIASESHDAVVSAAMQSYTQAAAYVLLLARLDWNLRAAASELWLSLDAVRSRIRRCAELAELQPSLFDGISRVDPAFVPTRRRGTAECLIALRAWLSRPRALRRANPYESTAA